MEVAIDQQEAVLPPLLTSSAARILNVTPDTVRAWERSGRLPAVKTDRGVRLFDRRDVERLARERETHREQTSRKLGPAGAVS
jgi:excisionase family DNA binding protein